MTIPIFSKSALNLGYDRNEVDKQARLSQRNKQIRQDYCAEFGKGFRTEVILEKLSGKYFMSPSTLWRIIAEQGHYKPKSESCQPANS